MANENLELEEKQVKEYDDKLLDYLFTCEGAGALEAKSSKLATKKPGIRLHFLRFALFPNSSKDQSSNSKAISSHQGQKSETIEEVSPEGAPPVEDFFYAKTHLNGGYVYIIDEENPNLWYEYEIDDLGNFYPVYWANNKDFNGNYLDIRKSSGKVTSNKTFKQGTVLRIAFSPVQWSIDYHTVMRTNTQRRKERMQKVVCTGFERGAESTSNFLTPFDTTFGMFPPEQKHQAFWLNNTMKEIIADDNVAVAKDPQSLKEDMFVTLHSPLACVLDINYQLGIKNIEFRSLVENIQTGQTIKVIKDILMAGDIDIPPISAEHQSLFSLALACYQIVYSDRETTEKYDGGKPEGNWNDTHFPRELAKQNKADQLVSERKRQNQSYSGGSENGYAQLGRAMQTGSQMDPNRYHKELYIGNGLDRQKIEGILGVLDRHELRGEILELRKKLAKFLNSTYCKEKLDDYLHNIEGYKLEGMAGIAVIFENLFVSPYDIDNHLLLKKDRRKDDTIKKWIYELIDEKSVEPTVTQTGIKSQTPGYQDLDPLHALMSSNLNLEHTWEDRLGTEVKMASFGSAILGFMTKKAFDLKVIDGKKLRSLKEVTEFVVKKLQAKYKYKGNPIYLLRKSEMYMQLDAFGVTGETLKTYVRVAPYAGRKDWLRIYKDSPEVHVEIDGPNKLISMPIEYDVELSQRDVQLNKINQKAAKILNSKTFTIGIAGLQMLNMYNAVTEFGKAHNNIEKLKTGANTIGVAADLTEAILNVQKASLTARGVQVTGMKDLFRASKVFGAIGGFATSAMCVWDSVDAFSDLDVDAGLAWAGAGVAYGVSTVMVTFCSGMAFAGPIGLIAAGVGLGLVVLANVLTDTDLEYYFKHFLLCDQVALEKKEGQLPGTYATYILENKKKLMGEAPEQKDINTIMNPDDAQVRLWDLLVCTQMLFVPTDSKMTSYTSYSSIGASTSSTIKYYSFDVTMQFMQFLELESEVETKAFLYPKGFKRDQPMEILSKKISAKKMFEINIDQKYTNSLKIKLNIPYAYKDQVTEFSDILFAVRINNKNTSFPFLKNENQKRYLGTIADLGTLTPILGTKQTEEIRIGTINELKGKDIWQ
ncbi:toxin VasX [Labilibaculum manganireducens]|uniref:toxin VasX n=1 Tax=Labilibaculum manganireducens TaxID=1940525 RepID=UPI0029F58FEE|nr:toxin VasX [Labilibaculum manganireducens]